MSFFTAIISASVPEAMSSMVVGGREGGHARK